MEWDWGYCHFSWMRLFSITIMIAVFAANIIAAVSASDTGNTIACRPSEELRGRMLELDTQEHQLKVFIKNVLHDFTEIQQAKEKTLSNVKSSSTVFISIEDQ